MGTFAERAFVRFFFIVCRLLPFASNKQKFAVSIFPLGQTNSSCRFIKFRFPFEDVETETWNLNVEIFLIFIYINKYICGYILIYRYIDIFRFINILIFLYM